MTTMIIHTPPGPGTVDAEIIQAVFNRTMEGETYAYGAPNELEL